MTAYRYDRTGERVEQDDERTDEQATLDHVAEVRRILREHAKQQHQKAQT